MVTSFHGHSDFKNCLIFEESGREGGHVATLISSSVGDGGLRKSCLQSSCDSPSWVPDSWLGSHAIYFSLFSDQFIINIIIMFSDHRYIMGRLPLNGFYLWRHVLSTAPPFILWWWKFEILFEPLPHSSSFLWGQRWQPIQMGHSLHMRGRDEGGLDTNRMSMY
jgi:hypothetical protein